ncbi:unnamed protein product [Nezara viridula]|uniref:Glucose-methanol-choline oxidoreductase N-terminal domain-containing protein n=1 Tax=Nezara viridula TaxID=85310 RepID=A0A9P0E958_NEZVI|nr:unnamed protein product [Nezara viridula]
MLSIQTVSKLIPEEVTAVLKYRTENKGCVLANRLTENPDWTVLLIEAGGDENGVSDTPIFEMLNHNSPRDWNYTTVLQKKACLSRNGTCAYPRGRVMGGSSTINGMMYVRGHKEDFEEWKNKGLTNWGYSDVLPYFIKAENNTEPGLAHSKYHGTTGPFNVQYPEYITPLRDDYIQAGKDLGWEKMDFNEPYKTGVIDYVQFAIDGPSRESASKAYLNPIRKRPNIHIIKNTVVTKVNLDNLIAKGVEYYRDRKIYQVAVEKEVILSAGAIDTPKILMLSGIGPKDELEGINIKVMKDLPVGKSMTDHPLIPIIFKLNTTDTITTDVWKTNTSIFDYAKERRGPLSTTGGEAMSFFNPINKEGLPTVQIMWHSVIQGIESQRENLIRVVTANVHPKSVGSVKLQSNNFKDPPLIDPNYFDEEIDYLMVEKGIETLFKTMEMPSMKKHFPEIYHESQPVCKEKVGKDFIRCTIDQYSQTVYHPVGTARMGGEEDEEAVCHQDLSVRGVEKLRVVDASAIPMVPRANTLAPTIMLAEKAADIIKEHYGFISKHDSKPKYNLNKA